MKSGRPTSMPAVLVHEGVTYDIEVDTGQTESLDCAHAIAARVV